MLSADDELNVSAFTARCAASAGALPYDVVSAALATLKGARHGGASEHVLALLTHAETPKAARAAIAEDLRRGNRVAGFGHPLYPGGDPRGPRCSILLAAAETGRRGTPFDICGEQAPKRRRRRQIWIFGLAAIAKTYALPERASILLFAIGRLIGWIGHAIEEYASGRLIRPRARYVGPCRPAKGAGLPRNGEPSVHSSGAVGGPCRVERKEGDQEEGAIRD